MRQKFPISVGPRWGGCLTVCVGLGFTVGGLLLLVLFCAIGVTKSKWLEVGLMSILPLLCVLVGIYLVRSGLRYDRFDRQRADSSSDKPAHTSCVLRPETPRWLKLGVTTTLCVLLNGLAIQSYLSNGVVLIPLVLGGLVLVPPALSNGLALFNPRFIIALGSNSVQPGEHVEMSWHIEGDVARIRNLTIALEAEEWARNQSSEMTYSSVFYRRAIVDLRKHEEIKHGRQNLNVPHFLPPTFDCPNNKITWTLRVQADVRWSANINDSYEFALTTREHLL